MIRKISSVIFYVLGGFFVYMVGLLAFTNIPQVGATKFYIVGGFSVPAIVFLIIGAAINRFQNWKHPVGIALLSGVAMNLFVVITLICLQLSNEFNELYPGNNLSYFNDYLSGISILLVLGCLGGFLIRKNTKEIAEPTVQPDR